MRRTRSGCCARADTGQTAAPPITVMNSRRFICGQSNTLKACRSPRVKGGKARSEHIPSGLPPKADIVDAFWDFRFVPKSEVTYSIVSSARASHSSTPYGPRVRTAALRRYGLVKTLHRAG